MIPQEPENELPSDVVHAAVVTSQKIIDVLGKELPDYFLKHDVNLINVAPAESYGPDAVTLILAGKEVDIKSSLEDLKKICNGKKLGLETTPISSLPPAYERYLSDIENKERFEKLFNYCSEEYLKECEKNNIQPHPEVLEGL